MANYSRLFQLDPGIDEQLKKKKLLAPAADMPDLFEGSGQHATVMQAAAEESARTQQAIGGAVKQGYERAKREQAKAAAPGSAPVGMPTAPAQPPLITPQPQQIRGGGPIPEQVPIPEAPIPDVVPETVKPPGHNESSPQQVVDFMENRQTAPQAQNLFSSPAGNMETAPDLSGYKQEYWKPQGVANMNPAVKKYRGMINYDFAGGMAGGGLVYGGRRGRKVRIGEDGEETLLIPPGSEAMVVPDKMPEVQGQNFQSPEIREIAGKADAPEDPGGYWEHPSHPNPMQGLIARRDRNLDLASMGPDVYQQPGGEPAAPRQTQQITPASGDMEEVRQDLGSPGVPGMGPQRQRVVPGKQVTSNFVGRPLDPVDKADLALRGRIQEGPIKKGVWSRLGKGFMWGLDRWKADGGPGGLGGAFGSGIAGLATYGFSPKTQAAIDYKQDVGKLMENYKTALQPQLMDMELKQEQAKTAGALADAQTKRLNTILTAYKPAIEAGMKAGKSVPQITKELNDRGIRATDFDVRKLIEGYDPNGLPQARYETGDPGAPPQWFPNPSRGPDLTKIQTPIKVDGKTVGHQLSPQAATTAVGAAGRADTIEVRKQALEQQAANQQRVQGNADRLYELSKKRYALSIQREGRIVEAARHKADVARNPALKKTVEKQTADLQKARKAYEDIAAEMEGIFSIPTDERSEAENKKLVTLNEKAKAALRFYDSISGRLESGN